TATKKELKEHYERALLYDKKLPADETWVIHFTCEENAISEPCWPTKSQLQRGLRVVYLWHDLDFTKIRITACDSKVIGPDNSPKANDYDDPMPSSMEKGTNEVQTDYDSDCSHDNDSEEDVSFSDNDKINDIDTMVSDDKEDAGYYYDLRTGNVAYKKSISVY
ncbi:17634_t:CDS:2, partial [Racocetra fulgida]